MIFTTLIKNNPTMATEDLLALKDDTEQMYTTYPAFANTGKVTVIRRQIL
jgi:hypothetical protein